MLRLPCGGSPRPGFPAAVNSYRKKLHFRQGIHNDARNRVSSFWIPTGGIAKKDEAEDSHELLVRAGYLRQTSPGVFHMLPLGLRVQEKIERLVDRHMRALGASKLSLSALSRQDMWKKSGRLADDSAVFRTWDRRGDGFLLAPTQEEELTSLVGACVKSYRDLPLRVYQISRKYRDELRPRQGLLRARDFTMKDLYTFDYKSSDALQTYDLVKNAYARLFDQLRLPYVVADADSGDMGGSLSHEFHIFSSNGEDTVFTCSKCAHSFNEEVRDGRASCCEQKPSDQPTSPQHEEGATQGSAVSNFEFFISKDKRTLIRAIYLQPSGSGKPRQVNPRAVASISRLSGVNIDFQESNPYETWQHQTRMSLGGANKEHDGSENGGNEATAKSEGVSVLDLVDFRVRGVDGSTLPHSLDGLPNLDESKLRFVRVDTDPNSGELLDLLKVQSGDKCPKCGAQALEGRSAIELAHTFHLGTKYSDVFGAKVTLDSSISDGRSGKQESQPTVVPLEMGCHGIGISRMIAAAADKLADSKGLNWPRVIAPFEVAIIAAEGLEKVAVEIYDKTIGWQSHGTDVILDDRQKSMPWKLGDADLIGYPIVLIVGKAWARGEVEVQCRQLDLRTTVPADQLQSLLSSLLGKL